MNNRKNFYILLICYLAFTLINSYVYLISPKQNYKEQSQTLIDRIEKQIPVTSRQDNAEYAKVLEKMKTCTGVVDKANNTYYTCSDGSTISVISWKRQERSGVVTRYYDKDKNLVMIYGHPDDTY